MRKKIILSSILVMLFLASSIYFLISKQHIYIMFIGTCVIISIINILFNGNSRKEEASRIDVKKVFCVLTVTTSTTSLFLLISYMILNSWNLLLYAGICLLGIAVLLGWVFFFLYSSKNKRLN